MTRRWRTRAQLWDEVVEVIAEATTDPQQNGVVGQGELARIVGCSAATLSAEMPNIVARSRETYPGYAVQVAPDRTLFGAPYRYRLVDEQAEYETRGSLRRLRKAGTAAKRVNDEVDVLRAGPQARAASALIAAGREMMARGEAMLAEIA